MDDATARKQRLRDKRRAEGMKAYEVWLDTDGQARLVTLRQPGESVDAVISRALVALERLIVHGTSHAPSVPSHVPSHETSAASHVPSHEQDAEPPAPALLTPQARKAELVTRLQQMQAQGMSLRAMAAALNAAGVPTISGRGQWIAGTISNLLDQAKAQP